MGKNVAGKVAENRQRIQQILSLKREINSTGRGNWDVDAWDVPPPPLPVFSSDLVAAVLKNGLNYQLYCTVLYCTVLFYCMLVIPVCGFQTLYFHYKTVIVSLHRPLVQSKQVKLFNTALRQHIHCSRGPGLKCVLHNNVLRWCRTRKTYNSDPPDTLRSTENENQVGTTNRANSRSDSAPSYHCLQGITYVCEKELVCFRSRLAHNCPYYRPWLTTSLIAMAQLGAVVRRLGRWRCRLRSFKRACACGNTSPVSMSLVRRVKA